MGTGVLFSIPGEEKRVCKCVKGLEDPMLPYVSSKDQQPCSPPRARGPPPPPAAWEAVAWGGGGEGQLLKEHFLFMADTEHTAFYILYQAELSPLQVTTFETYPSLLLFSSCQGQV